MNKKLTLNKKGSIPIISPLLNFLVVYWWLVLIIIIIYFGFIYTGELIGCQVEMGTTTISSFDGQNVHIPFSIASPGYSCASLKLAETSALSEADCNTIGWRYDAGSKTCNPTNSLQGLPYSVPGTISVEGSPWPYLTNCGMRDNAGYDWRTYHPDNTGIAVKFAGSNIALSSPSPIFECSGEIVIRVIPETETSDEVPPVVIPGTNSPVVTPELSFFDRLSGLIKGIIDRILGVFGK